MEPMGSVALNAFTAVIDATAGCAPGDTGLPPALVPVAGVPLLTRNLEACLSAGIRKVLVTVAGSSLDEARRLGRRLAPRLLVEVIPAAPSDPWLAVRNGLNRAALVLAGDTLVEADLLVRMQSGPLPEDGALLAVERGEGALAALPPGPSPAVLAGGVRVRGDRLVEVGLAPEDANGRATGVWLASAALLDEVAAARLDGREASLDAVLRAAAGSGRLGWVSTGPEASPMRVAAASVRATEEHLLSALAGSEAARSAAPGRLVSESGGPVERLTRVLLRRVVLKLGLSVGTTAVVAIGLSVAAAFLLVLAGWSPLLSLPGAALALVGVLAARVERRQAALHGRRADGASWGSLLRDDALGLLFFAALGLHLSIAATSSAEVVPGGGLSRASNVYLVLSLLFVVLVAYSRYVVYFDTVRRLGGIGAHARFSWWFEDAEAGPLSGWRALLQRASRARWSTVVALGALGVLVGLTHVAFLLAVLGSAGVFALALLHQIQRGDL
jgi:hypothetical protein